MAWVLRSLTDPTLFQTATKEWTDKLEEARVFRMRGHAANARAFQYDYESVDLGEGHMWRRGVRRHLSEPVEVEVRLKEANDLG